MSDLRVAVEAIAVALDALRAGPDAVAVVGALDQAAAAVAALEQSLVVQVLQRLLVNIERCHRAGLTSSPGLEASCRAAAVALRMDPRWAE